MSLWRMFDTNALGAYLCAREPARKMPSSEDGRDTSIVIISSAASRSGSPHEYVDYAGSKNAMDSLNLGLSKELGLQGIRVNDVRPDLITTDIHESAGDADRKSSWGPDADAEAWRRR